MGGGGQQSSFASSGRGGAGNFVDKSQSPRIEPKDLETPTLKSSMVTTGRGGSGNIVPNKDPKETRALQDVQAVPRRLSQGATHIGRGGEGNVIFGAESDEAKEAKSKTNENAISENPEGESGHHHHHHKEDGKDESAAKTAAEKAEEIASKGKEILTGKKA